MTCPTRQTGFTAVELVATTALAAVLMLAVLSVSASIGTTHRLMRQRQAGQFDQSRLRELIRWDLMHATTVRTDSEDQPLATQGPSGIDPATQRPTHRLVRVDYQIRQQGDHAWLIRRQRYLDSQGYQAPWQSPIAAHVQSLAVERLESEAGGESSEDDRPRMQRWRVRIVFTNDKPAAEWQIPIH